MDQQRLTRIIQKHKWWLEGKNVGERANFLGEDLTGANLSNTDLSKASFVNSKLTGANMMNTNFSYANFTGADFSSATTTGANFENAIFQNTINVPDTFPDVVPETGEFTAYKKVKSPNKVTRWNESKCKNEYDVEDTYYIAKLLVPAIAKRSNGTPQIRHYSSYDSQNEYTTNTIQLTKCRVSQAEVESLYYMNGKQVTDNKLSCVSCIYEGTTITDATLPQYWDTITEDDEYKFDDYKVVFLYCKIRQNTASAIRIRIYFDSVTDLDSLDTTTNSEYPQNNYRYNIFHNTETLESYQWYPSTQEWKLIDDEEVITSLHNLSELPAGQNDGKIIITYGNSTPDFGDINDGWVKRSDELFSSVAICKKAYYKTEYKRGRTVYSDYWDDDRWNICSHGIHCFMSFDQAKKYTYEENLDRTYLINKLQDEVSSLIAKKVIPQPVSMKMIDELNIKKVVLSYGFSIDFYDLDYIVTDLNSNLKYGFADREDESYYIEIYVKDSSVDYTLYDLQKDINAIIDNRNITRPADIVSYSSSSGAYLELVYFSDATASTIRADAATIKRMITQYSYQIVSDTKAKTNRITLTT